MPALLKHLGELEVALSGEKREIFSMMGFLETEILNTVVIEVINR